MYIYNNKKLQEEQQTLGLSIAENLLDDEDNLRSTDDILLFFNDTLSNDESNNDELHTAHSSNAESSDDNLISTSFKNWGIASTYHM